MTTLPYWHANLPSATGLTMAELGSNRHFSYPLSERRRAFGLEVAKLFSRGASPVSLTGLHDYARLTEVYKNNPQEGKILAFFPTGTWAGRCYGDGLVLHIKPKAGGETLELGDVVLGEIGCSDEIVTPRLVQLPQTGAKIATLQDPTDPQGRSYEVFAQNYIGGHIPLSNPADLYLMGRGMGFLAQKFETLPLELTDRLTVSSQNELELTRIGARYILDNPAWVPEICERKVAVPTLEGIAKEARLFIDNLNQVQAGNRPDSWGFTHYGMTPGNSLITPWFEFCVLDGERIPDGLGDKLLDIGQAAFRTVFDMPVSSRDLTVLPPQEARQAAPLLQGYNETAPSILTMEELGQAAFRSLCVSKVFPVASQKALEAQTTEAPERKMAVFASMADRVQKIFAL